MHVQTTDLSGHLIIEPCVYVDARGYFLETYNRDRYQHAGVKAEFVQDNFSHSIRGTVRGLHYQVDRPQGKLVWAIRGEIFDIAVDLRKSSPTFGRWVGAHLSGMNHRQVYVPPEFAHGFCVLSEVAEVAYKCTDAYSPASERTIIWNDPFLNINWPLTVDQALVSERDRHGTLFSECTTFE